MVEGPIGVSVEEPEVGSSVVSKERTGGQAVLRDDQEHEGRGSIQGPSLTAFHISSSRLRIPVPRKVSLLRFTMSSQEIIRMDSQQLFLGIPAGEICMAGHQQELDVFGVHSDKLHMS